jgi:hypothetical protein
MAVTDLIREIQERRAEALERKREIYPKNNPTASDLSPCARETALAILHWQQRPPFPSELLARLERGKVIEDVVLRELSALGLYARVERKPFEIRGRNGQLLLRGKIDGFLEWEGTDYPMEVKSLDRNLFARIDAADDFNRYGLLAKWPRQIQAYLYANGLAEGFFLLDDCQGHWKLVPITLNYDVMEGILRQCEEATRAVELVRLGAPEDDALPPYHGEISVCRRCWAFARVCNPPNLATSEGLRVIDDPALELMLTRRDEIVKLAREYERLDDEIKKIFRNVPESVCGPFLIRGKVQPRHYKAKEAVTINTWVTTIDRLAPEPQPESESESESEVDTAV